MTDGIPETDGATAGAMAHAVDPALHRVLIEQVPRIGRLERIHDVEQRVGTIALAYLAAHYVRMRYAKLMALNRAEDRR